MYAQTDIATHLVKIAIIGASEVGKTTIATAFRDAADRFTVFDPAEDDDQSVETFYQTSGSYAKTTSADLFEKTLRISQICEAMDMTRFSPVSRNLKNDKIKVTIWDTAGYEKYGTFPPNHLLRACNVLVVCFSCVSYDSISKANTLLEYVSKTGYAAKGCVCIALGTKVDLLLTKCIQPRNSMASNADDGNMFKEATLSWVTSAFEEYHYPEGLDAKLDPYSANNLTSFYHVGEDGYSSFSPSSSTKRVSKTKPTHAIKSLNVITGNHVREAICGLTDTSRLKHENWWVLGGHGVNGVIDCSPSSSLSTVTYGTQQRAERYIDSHGTFIASFERVTKQEDRNVLMSFTSATKVRHCNFVNPVYCIYHAIGLHLERKTMDSVAMGGDGLYGNQSTSLLGVSSLKNNGSNERDANASERGGDCC